VNGRDAMKIRLAVAVTLWSVVIASCGSTASSPPATGQVAATPCSGLMACSASPPFRTLPPIPTEEPGPTSGTSAQTFRVAVGACLRYAPGGPALADIVAHDPDLMLWLGDNIYADTEDMAEMRAIYDQLGENGRFKALAAAAEMMAVWDDHDMGWNNANATWPHRDAAKAEFLRFWGAAPDDERWDQPGVYSARTFGSGDRTVQVILLDNRYNLDPWDYAGEDPGRRILGDEQWAWLRDASRSLPRSGSSAAASRSSRTTTSTRSGRAGATRLSSATGCSRSSVGCASRA
jgi:hypothetical protein